MCDGQIAIEVTGGTPSYSYRWSNGYDMTVLEELCDGDYQLTVTDAHGCNTSGSFNIIQPEAISASATGQDVSCYGSNDGIITVAVSGGTEPYRYALNEFMSQSVTLNNLENLAAGEHTVYITDAKGCMTRTNAIIGSPERITVEYQVVDISCKEAADGEIYIAAEGGHPPYYITTDGESNTPLTENAAVSGLRSGIYHLVICIFRFLINQSINFVICFL